MLSGDICLAKWSVVLVFTLSVVMGAVQLAEHLCQHQYTIYNIVLFINIDRGFWMFTFPTVNGYS